jgi:hypothetical protein
MYPLYAVSGLIYGSSIFDDVRFDLTTVVNTGLFTLATLVVVREGFISPPNTKQLVDKNSHSLAQLARVYLFLAGVSYILLGLLFGVALNSKGEGNLAPLLLALPAAFFTSTLSLIVDMCNTFRPALSLGCGSFATESVGVLILVCVIAVRKSPKWIYPLCVASGLIVLSGLLDGLEFELGSVVNAGLFVLATLVLARETSTTISAD